MKRPVNISEVSPLSSFPLEETTGVQKVNVIGKIYSENAI
jgi:hypothetical protein